jgi:hypothetical protein
VRLGVGRKVVAEDQAWSSYRPATAGCQQLLPQQPQGWKRARPCIAVARAQAPAARCSSNMCQSLPLFAQQQQQRHHQHQWLVTNHTAVGAARRVVNPGSPAPAGLGTGCMQAGG